MYNCIICRYHEIATKGNNRNMFERCLVDNLKHQLKELGICRVHRVRGRIWIDRADGGAFSAEELEAIRPRIAGTFGLESFSPVVRLPVDMDAIRRAGISEFIFENRGGDWFCTEPWMRLFEEVLQYAAACRMRVWLLDDSHVNTGSANDSLKRPENAPFRQQCLRIELMDVVGPLSAGAAFLPEHTAAETILAIAAYRRDGRSGECTGDCSSCAARCVAAKKQQNAEKH